MIKILIVEDELPISNLIKMSLGNAGYTCHCAFNGNEAISFIDQNSYDLILLDIMLPCINGYELLTYIKPLGVPVIFITAKNSLDDRVKGLDLGAEDYIVKPFEIVELLARVNVVLRRYNKSSSVITYEDITVDTENMTVEKNNVPIVLTPKELQLLIMLVRNVDITLFREKIYETIWESDFLGDTRTVDLHIQRLRKKLGLEDKLKTIYKVGYRLER